MDNPPSAAELTRSEAEIARLVAIHCVDPTGKADPILDGVIEPARYVQAPVKILWILKEPWDGADHSGGGWNLCGLLSTRARDMMKGSTFRNIYYVTYGMLKGVRDWNSIPYPKNDPDAAATLQSIAFINAKKLPGPRRGSKPDGILSAYEKSREIIRRQITAYRPDVVLGCAPHMPRIIDDMAGERSPGRRRSGHVRHLNLSGTIYMEVFHPAQVSIRHADYVADILRAFDDERERLAR